MSGQLPAKTLVNALIRRVNQAGGFASVLARGEDMGGMILVQAIEKGRHTGFFERLTNLDGIVSLERCGPPMDSDSLTITDYLDRRRSRDPDLWIIELDVPDAERFAAETIAVS